MPQKVPMTLNSQDLCNQGVEGQGGFLLPTPCPLFRGSDVRCVCPSIILLSQPKS